MELIPGTTLITSTPEEGRALAITLARHSIHAIQSDMEVLKACRPKYGTNPRDAEAAGSSPATPTNNFRVLGYILNFHSSLCQ